MFRKVITACLGFLVCIGIAAWTEGESLNRVVSERLIVQIDFSSWIPQTFSTDSKCLAYAAKLADKMFIVVDGKEGKQYDGIVKGALTFSTDGGHLAYAAAAGNRQFVVVDEKEGKQYDAIVTTGGGRVIFDSPDSLHYLALRGNSIYLVTERIE